MWLMWLMWLDKHLRKILPTRNGELHHSQANSTKVYLYQIRAANSTIERPKLTLHELSTLTILYIRKVKMQYM